MISRKRTTKLQAVTCCQLYVCARVCVSRYSWRTCLVRTQVVSSWVGGREKFLAYLIKLRGVALDSLWRFGSREPLPHLLALDYHQCIMHVDMHKRVYKTDWHPKTSLHLLVLCSTWWCLWNVSIRKHERCGVGLHQKQWWVSICPPNIIFWCQGQSFLSEL